MIDPRDMEHCVAAIRHGSRSFHASSKLLPRSLRDPALALYAFCRLADDAVDLQPNKSDAVLRLQERVDLAYAGRPQNAPADRAFAAIIADFEMPRALPEALLEGLAWDAMGRRYSSLSDLHAYSARVASAVGAMMCVLMGVRDADALARACDLGVAMQLTNIARDVGEDSFHRRIYLPLDWLAAERIHPEAFFADPLPDEKIRRMVRRLLLQADRLYFRAEAGIPALPLAARPGIYAARHVYAGIGGAIVRNGYDTVSYRARTYRAQKAGWLGLSLARSGLSLVMPMSAVLYGRPLEETRFLVEAAARAVPEQTGRAERLLGLFADLEARERETRGLEQSGV